MSTRPNVPTATVQPGLFVPHGAPTFILRHGAAGAALARLAQDLSPPKAIIVVSAHWDTKTPTVGLSEHPQTLHDFWGFPGELYERRYPAQGRRDMALTVVSALLEAGLDACGDEQRGLDHGAWIPLSLMFAQASAPVIPLSIQRQGGPQQAWRLGRALAPLAKQGYLVVGSGNLTHNLADYHLARETGQTPAYVHAFTEWLADRLHAGDLPALLDYRRQAPDAARAHPTDEHLLPLYVAYGAAGDLPRSERFYAGVDEHVIAMDAYAFHPGDSARVSSI